MVAVSELTRDGAALLRKNQHGRQDEMEPRRSASYHVATPPTFIRPTPISDVNDDGCSVPGVEDSLFYACVGKLVKVVTPEAMCRLHESHLKGTMDIQRAAGKRESYLRSTTHGVPSCLY